MNDNSAIIPQKNRIISAAISPNGKDIVDVDTKGLHLSEAETGKIHDVALPEELRAHLWVATLFPDGDSVCAARPKPPKLSVK